VILSSLNTAIAHAEQKEWTDRPNYQNGFAGYDFWASLIAPGRKEKDAYEFAAYYAGHYYSARCYARDYLRSIAEGDVLLLKAADAYEKVAGFLKPLWDHFRTSNTLENTVLSMLAENIRKAKAAEEEGIGFLKQYIQKM